MDISGSKQDHSKSKPSAEYNSEQRIILDDKSKTVLVTNLILDDLEVFNILAAKEERERTDFVKKAVKIGSIAIKDITVTEKIDYVQKEFERLESRLNTIFQKQLGEEGMEGELAKIFGENGELQSSLKEIFGDDGKLARDLLNTDNKNSPLSKLKESIESCFVGKDSDVYCMLDPHEEGSPANRLRKDLMDILIDIKGNIDTYIAKKGVIEITPLKGKDFEDKLDPFLWKITHPFKDHVERVNSVKGKKGSQKGDFVITINGSSDKIVVEAKSLKDKVSLTRKGLLGYLDEAMENREAKFAIAVSENPLQSIGKYREFEMNKVVCEFGDGGLPLEVAYEVSRAKLLIKENEAIGKVDVNQISGRIEAVETDLRTIQGIKSKLTNIKNLSESVKDELDELKGRVQDNLAIISRLLIPLNPENLQNNTTVIEEPQENPIAQIDESDDLKNTEKTEKFAEKHELFKSEVLKDESKNELNDTHIKIAIDEKSSVLNDLDDDELKIYNCLREDFSGEAEEGEIALKLGWGPFLVVNRFNRLKSKGLVIEIKENEGGNTWKIKN